MLNRLSYADKLDICKLNAINNELTLYLRPLQHFDSVLLQLRKLIQLLKNPQIVLLDEINQHKTILAISLILMRINNTLRNYEMSDTYTALKKIIGLYVTDLEILDYLKNPEHEKIIDTFINANVKEEELQPLEFKPINNIITKTEIKFPSVPSHHNRKFSLLPKVFLSEEKNTESNNLVNSVAKKM